MSSKRQPAYKDGYSDMGERQIATWNDFFRPENSKAQRLIKLAKISTEAACESRPFRIADIGCSKGMDTYSLAATFLTENVSAHITGFDINPVVLTKASQPYAATTRAMLAEKIQRWQLPAGTIHLFERDGVHGITPSQLLRGMVSFRQADIRYDQLEPAYYDAITANNIFSYYVDGNPKCYLGGIAANVSRALVPGGTLFINKCMGDLQPALGEHGLEPIAELCDDPSGPTFFKRVAS